MDPLLRPSVVSEVGSKKVINPNPLPPIARRPARRKIIIGSIVVGLFCVAVVTVLLLVIPIFNRDKQAALVDSSRYQSVFLTNGQVYFGKITTLGNDYLRMTDIYYLQVQQTVQPTDTKKSLDSASTKPQLIKLGNELHSPDDAMQINRDQVLFWENIKSDGQVVKAINDFKSK